MGTRCAFGKAESWDRDNVISTRVGIPSLQHACDSQAFSRSSRERRGDSAPDAVEVQDVSVEGMAGVEGMAAVGVEVEDMAEGKI
jgi:hypothetical protein